MCVLVFSASHKERVSAHSAAAWEWEVPVRVPRGQSQGLSPAAAGRAGCHWKEAIGGWEIRACENGNTVIGFLRLFTEEYWTVACSSAFFPSQTSGSVHGNFLVDGKTINFTQLESCLSLWWIVDCEKTKSLSFHFLCMEELQDSALTILIRSAWIMTDCTHVTSAVMPAVCNRFTSFQGIRTTWLIDSPCYPFPLLSLSPLPSHLPPTPAPIRPHLVS